MIPELPITTTISFNSRVCMLWCRSRQWPCWWAVTADWPVRKRLEPHRIVLGKQVTVAQPVTSTRPFADMQRTDSLYSDLRALNIRKCGMCIVMETNELTSIDDKLVDTSTIHTTMSIHNLLNIDSTVGGWTGSRPTARRLLPQGMSQTPPSVRLFQPIFRFFCCPHYY